MKYLLLATAVMAVANPAFADTVVADTKQTPVAKTNEPIPEVPEIIVTAEHRAVSLQRIPLAVTVIDAATLERDNISSASQLQNTLPGLKILEVGVQPSIFIRGIGAPVANGLNDPAAVYNVDGVSIARPIAINGLFFDLERVEVLKGPQGTLYGGNSTVGAINVVSHRPDFAYEGSAGVTFGNYNTVRTEGVINAPLGDTLALRASFETSKHDGYLTNGSDDADDVGARVKALYKPSPDFEALITGTYFHSGGVGPGDVPLSSPSGSYLNPSNPWFLGTGPDLENGSTVVPNNGHQSLTTKGVNAQIKLRTDIGTFTVVPSYSKTNYGALAYDGGFYKNYNSADREAGVEARLASNDDNSPALKWTVGGIYQNVHQAYDVVQHIAGASAAGPDIYQQLLLDLHTRSFGLFAQATYKVFDALRLTGGIRYTNDSKTVTGPNKTIVGAPDGPVVGSFLDDGAATFSNVSYRVGFDYDVARNILFYGNVSSGYKSGGINPGLAPNIYNPEHLTSFQLGLKNDLLGHRLKLNFEGWYWKYSDFQIEQFILLNTPVGPQPGFGTVNANKAKNYGVEMLASYTVTPHDQLGVNLQYDIARYTDFIQTLVFPVRTTSNYDGEAINFAPNFSGNANYSHTFDLDATTKLIASIDDQFNGPVLTTIQRFPGQHIGSTNVTNAQLTLRFADGKWDFGGYINNIQNTPVLVFAGATPAGVWGHPAPPRTFGVRLHAHF